MSLTAAAMERLADMGLSMAQVIEIARLNEDNKVETSAERRRRLDRERKQRGKLAENSAESAESNAEPIPQILRKSAENSAESAPPHVRVLDKPLTKVLTGLAVVVDEARANGPATDWPTDKFAQRLAAAVESPFLDPSKSPGLITSGRVLDGWRKAGASWEHDVVPIVAALAAKNRKQISSWAYFEAAVLQSAADSRRALTLPEASQTRQANHRERPADQRQAAREDNHARAFAGSEASLRRRAFVDG